ncbi:hypothetical protein FIBSPDRAFT_1044596 [Athelia psychrophila]|uniref:Uncharacterized protein n=1 Tax=Athelia psychrophila TaxID=1759441 RepID=A0A166JFD6_9AGAM|nr:hypothetical protein FIBSPDRAFT_1044596 [Fibularhizoctonia sp. CBS 109695]
MRFSIAVFATIALSVFASATPVVVRDASVQGVQSILTTLKTAVTPLAAQLGSIQSKDATSAVVKPLIKQLTTAISAATTKVGALKGQPQSVVLSSASSNELVPLQTVAKLVADILTLLIPVLAHLYKILGPGGDLTPVLPPVGAALSSLVGGLLVVVAGLVVALAPLLAGLLAGLSALVTSLGLGPLIVALGL